MCQQHSGVQVIQLSNGAVLHSFAGDTEPVTALAFSPNGQHIFAASRSLACKAWELPTGQCFRTWRVRTP